MDFTQNKAYENIITMKVNYNFSAFLSNTGKIYYNGTYYPKKAVVDFEGRPFSFIGTEEIVLSHNFLYMIDCISYEFFLIKL